MCQDTYCTCQTDIETAAERFIEVWEGNYSLQEETIIEKEIVQNYGGEWG